MCVLVNRSEATRESYSHYMGLFSQFAGSSPDEMLRQRNAAGHTASQTWIVTVIKDTTAPTISGLADQEIAYGSTVTVSIADDQSGINWNSLSLHR